MQHQINSLLDKVAFTTGTLKEARNRFADRLAPDFNIFDYLRTDEMGLSRCIADLLNPSGKHGQKEVFLEAFLKLLEIDWPANTKTCSVELEKQANGQRRIDIYLRFEKSEIIGIENKPWAGDQRNQLSDYASFIEKEANGNKWLLIYLSNNEPSNNSGIKEKQEALENEGKFIQLSYTRIIDWLEDCACKSKALSVRLFIEELAKFIRRNINGELEMSEENEIKNIILASSTNLESAFHVSLAMRSVKEALLKEFHNDLQQKLGVKGFELIWDNAMSKGWKSYAGFGVKFNKEQNLYLRFEFYSSGLHDLFWGIRREDASIKRNDVIWGEINDMMNTKFGWGGKSYDWWPWWNWVDKEFSDAYRNWDSSETPWIAIKEKKLAEEITNLAVRVHDAFNENLELLSVKASLN